MQEGSNVHEDDFARSVTFAQFEKKNFFLTFTINPNPYPRSVYF